MSYCKGELEFDPKYFNIVDESTRDRDLIGSLKKELCSLEVSSPEELKN